MLTYAESPYVNKRCSGKTPHCLKIKAMQDFEAEIVGYVPAMYSYGKTVPEALRGTPKSEMGALILRPIAGNAFGFTETFHCGTGFSQEQRVAMISDFESYKGKQATIKFMKAGNDIRPRQPVFKHIREDY